MSNKINKFIDYDECGDPNLVKIYVCHCEQCKSIKNKHKNRKIKKNIKRLLNKKRRKNSGEGVIFYWA
jgi:hypothetical protein